MYWKISNLESKEQVWNSSKKLNELRMNKIAKYSLDNNNIELRKKI
jgi:hypothetical protein